jgi:hypothetical protein
LRGGQSKVPTFDKNRIKLHFVEGKSHMELRDGDIVLAEYHDRKAIRDIRAGLIDLETSRLTWAIWDGLWPRIHVKICGEIITEVWQSDVQRLARIFPDLRTATPYGDQNEVYAVNPDTGERFRASRLPTTNSPAIDSIVFYRSLSANRTTPDS